MTEIEFLRKEISELRDEVRQLRDRVDAMSAVAPHTTTVPLPRPPFRDTPFEITCGGPPVAPLRSASPPDEFRVIR